MTTEAIPATSRFRESRFQTTRVLFIALAHFVHDTYPAFLAPLLPLLTEKPGLSLALAGRVTRVSGQRWGRGMSFFMAGGELGRSLGPVLDECYRAGGEI